MYDDYYEFVTVEELADILRIGLSTAYRLIRTGEIESFRVGNSHRIEREAISDFIIKNTQKKKWISLVSERRGITLHNLKIEIDENLKEQIYQYAGFKFSNSQLSDQELSYKTVFYAIDPGPEFNRICKVLELDNEVAG